MSEQYNEHMKARHFYLLGKYRLKIWLRMGRPLELFDTLGRLSE
jgi:hypothetical protein